MIHSSGTNNAYLKSYIQPTKTDLQYKYLESVIGHTVFIGNDFNHSHRSFNFHYFVGKLNNNEIGIVQAHPEDMKT